VVRSYASGGAVFDCTRQTGPLAHPTGPTDIPAGPAGAAETAAQARICPPGSVPVRRMTLSDLVQFSSLRRYLGKGPGGPGQLPPTGSS